MVVIKVNDFVSFCLDIVLKLSTHYFCYFFLLKKIKSGQCGSQGAPGRENLSESKLRDFLHGSEYVLTYEDKDGDWMLVGDVPWE